MKVTNYAYEISFILLVLLAYLTSLYATMGNAAYWWDEAEYGVLSKGITDEGFFGFFGAFSFRPPMLPLFASIAKGFMGTYAMTIILPFFSALSVAFLFLTTKKLFGTIAAIIASLLLLCSTLFFFYSGRFLTEIPGILFTTLSVYFLAKGFESKSRRDFTLFGLFSLFGFVVFYRYLLVLFALVVYVILFKFLPDIKDILTAGKKASELISEFKLYLISAAVFVFGLIPLFVYGNTYFKGPLGIFASTYNAGEPVPWDYFITTLSHILSNNFVIILLLLSLLYSVLYNQKQIRFFSMLSLIILISASVLLSHKEDRYLMPIFPIAFVAIAAFCAEIIRNGIKHVREFKSEGAKTEQSVIRIVFAVVVLFMLYVATFDNITSAMQLYDSKKTSFGDVKQAAQYVRDNTLPNQVLLTDSVTAMYHSERVSRGFDSGNLSRFLGDMDNYKPAYLIATLYESRENYANALNSYRDLTTATNSMEYVLLNGNKFQIVKVYPSEQTPYVMVFKVNA